MYRMMYSFSQTQFVNDIKSHLFLAHSSHSQGGKYCNLAKVHFNKIWPVVKDNVILSEFSQYIYINSIHIIHIQYIDINTYVKMFIQVVVSNITYILLVNIISIH